MSVTEPAASASTPSEETGPTLARGEVGLLGSTVFAMAGAAPGQTVSIVLASLVATAAYGTILPLIITTVGLLCIAIAFQRLNMWRQNAGATYEWVCRAFSPYVGNLVGWLMLVAFGGFVLIDVITIGPSVLSLIGVSPSNQWAGTAAIVILGSALTATAVVGLRPSARLQITVAVIEYSILLVFVVWAFIEIYIVHKSGTVRPSTKWLTFKGTGAGSFTAAMIIAVASVAGWDGGIYVNEETQRPERNPGLGAVVAVAILGVIFVLMFAAFQGIAPLHALEGHEESALAFAGHRLGGTAGERVMSLAVVLSVLATTQVAIIGTSRLMFSMSRDKVLPSPFGVVSERFRTPAFATAALGIFMMALGVVDIFATSVANAINELVAVSGFLYSLFYAITGLAAAWFYRRFIGRSVKDAILLGVMPLSGAGLLLWVAYEGGVALSSTEQTILAVVGALGVVMLMIAIFIYKAPIFKIKAEAATTTEPTIQIENGLRARWRDRREWRQAVENLDGRVAVVTGAAKGIGRGIAEVLLGEGASVVLADLDGDRARELAAELGGADGRAIAVQTDVTDGAALTSMAAAAVERFGRIDILAANAGIYPHIPFAELEQDAFDQLMAINVRGAVFAAQACIPVMAEQGYGRIVLTSSITGSVVGQPGYAHYGASKAAMLGFMRSAAIEVAGDGITINAVLPGNIRTPGFDDLGREHEQAMLAAIPLGMFGEPEDVGWAVRFLASTEARYITGQTLVIDGGQVLPESA